MNNKKQLDKMLRLANIVKKPLNESSSVSTIEFIKSAPDGNTYAIVRENRTYFIKSTETKDTLLESDFDYLGGLGNRTKNSFRGYDDAVTRINLMFNDINRVQGIDEGVDMVNFSHTLNENGEYVITEKKNIQEKKFILKQPKPKTKPAPEPAPEPEMDLGDDFNFGGDTEEEGGDDFNFGDDTEEEGGEFDFGDESTEEEGGDDFDFGGDTEEEGGDDFNFGDDTEEEGGDGIKDIQRSTGKLGQQLRDTEDISSDMQKWVAKSVISALNLNTMDDSDRDDIINALESGGNEESQEEDVSFMDDGLEYGEVEYANGRTFDNEDRAGEPNLGYGEEILLDDEDEGPGGYIGGYGEMPISDVDMGIQDKGMLNNDINYMSDDDMELCEDDGCDGMEEGMSSWVDTDDDTTMGWKTESVSYMGDEYSDEDIAKMFDNTGISDDTYGMNNPQETPAQPTTKPDTDTPAPTRPSKNPFTPPSRIRPGEEPKPKARKNGRETDYMAAEPRPSQEPNESPTIAPTRPDTDTPAPTRPSKNPFTPPSRIRPGEEPKPKAETDYMGDEDVEFS